MEIEIPLFDVSRGISIFMAVLLNIGLVRTLMYGDDIQIFSVAQIQDLPFSPPENRP